MVCIPQFQHFEMGSHADEAVEFWVLHFQTVCHLIIDNLVGDIDDLMLIVVQKNTPQKWEMFGSHFFPFFFGNVIIPTDEVHHFSEG